MSKEMDEPSSLPPTFTPEQTAQIAAAYDFADGLVIQPFHRGENHHYHCQNEGRDYFARLTPHRGAGDPSVESELAWIEALSETLAVPGVVRCRDGAIHMKLRGKSHDTVLVIFEMLYGYHLTSPMQDDWHRYGQVLREFHDASRDILEQSGRDWVGRTRKRFDPENSVQLASEAISGAAWVSRDLAADFSREAIRLTKAVSGTDLARDTGSLIHFDLHLANILLVPSGTPSATGDAWTLLDFEECCFGPRAIDLGVVRLHARTEGHLETAWEPFTAGYGDDTIANLAPLGAALKAFHLAGKIPERLDVPDVAKDPTGILKHLLTTIRSELKET